MSLELTDSHPVDRAEEILTGDALAFVETLHRRFAARRDDLLAARATRREQVASAGTMDFLPGTAEVRTGEWTVAPAPPALQDRRVEMTGPATPAKMAINAFNSGAKVWLADLEDASCPTWPNIIDAILNIRDGALVDFGLHFFHLAQLLIDNGHGPYYYLPKMESHLEARLWNDIFTFAEAELGIPYGTIRATVLIETIPAAFEMEEILYELRDHASGLNAGRWDYLFSIIKYFRDAGPDFVIVDRGDITMTAPFMRAYTELLVKTCHQRGAFAMGGMAAFIPSRKDPDVNAAALAKVKADKTREAGDGFDGSWVAHPDLVPVCQEVFDGVLRERPNQMDKRRDDVHVTADQLLDIRSAEGSNTEQGLRNNLYVAVAYVAVWLSGNGAVAIHNLMEDAATAEISRSQVWQLRYNHVKLADTGETVTADLVARLLGEEAERLRGEVPAETYARYYEPAKKLISDLCLRDDFTDFLTLPAYDLVS